jgi:hypothetical protein
MLSLALGILAIMYISVFKSINNLTREQSLRAHEFFVTERITLASALIFGMIQSIYIATFIFLIAISITLISQHLLRKRYEFVEKT